MSVDIKSETRQGAVHMPMLSSVLTRELSLGPSVEFRQYLFGDYVVSCARANLPQVKHPTR